MTQENKATLGIDIAGVAGMPLEILERPADFENELPYIRRTVSFVRQYELAKPKGREKLLEQLAGTLTKDVDSVSPVLNNLELINALSPIEGLDEIKIKLKTHVAKDIGISIRTWSAEKIERLITTKIDSQGEEAEFLSEMSVALFNNAKTPDDAVNIHYSAAYAMVVTQNDDVREELFSILCYEKDWFPVTSDSVFHFSNAVFTGDTNIKKFAIVSDALLIVGRYLETESSVIPDKSLRVALRDQALMTDRFRGLSQGELEKRRATARFLLQKAGQRASVMQDYFTRGPHSFGPELMSQHTILGDDKTFKDIIGDYHRNEQVIKNYPYPISLLYAEDPLRDLLTKSIHAKMMKKAWNNMLADAESGLKRITPKSIEVDDNLELDILTETFYTPEQRALLVREMLETFLTGQCPNPSRNLRIPFDGLIEATSLQTGTISSFDKEGTIWFGLFRKDIWGNIGRLSSLIEYVRPVISQERTIEIEKKVGELRQSLRTEFTRAVGKRGYEVLVADPVLRRFGYESFEFKLDSNTNAIFVNLVIGGEDYKFKLGSDYRTMFEGDVNEFRSGQDQAWLELLTLSHLKKVICTDQENIKDELLAPEIQYPLYRKQAVLSRVEHLRKLPPGQKFSQEQFRKCLESELYIKDLYAINRMRASINKGGTMESGMWTYVTGYEKDMDTQLAKPVKMAFLKASSDIREVVQLSDISEEELKRMEQEILSNLAQL